MFRLSFGPPKFPRTKSGYFGAFFEKRSILVIFDLRHPTTLSFYVNFDPYTQSIDKEAGNPPEEKCSKFNPVNFMHFPRCFFFGFSIFDLDIFLQHFVRKLPHFGLKTPIFCTTYFHRMNYRLRSVSWRLGLAP